MTDSVFDTALEKRFVDSAEAVSVTSADTLLIRDNETGLIFKLPVSVLNAALGSAFASLEAWQVPTLLNSWANIGGSWDGAAYYKDNFGIVHLRGLIVSGTMNAAAFTLPAGYRPAKEKRIATVSADSFGALMIGTDGSVIPYVGSNGWFSFDEISFRAA